MDYLTELIQILSYELPKNQCLPIEIIKLILFKFSGLQNKNYMDCFKEFKNIKFNLNYLEDNPIKVSDKFIKSFIYDKSKNLNKLLLRRIFFTRMKNDINSNIFTLKFCYGNNKRYTMSRKLGICKTRYKYLLKPERAEKKKISLITKLLIIPSCNFLTFSESFLEKEITQELGLDYNYICIQKLHRTDLIKLYLSFE
tara:strand:- start:15331 stop:15924 length:594 start_codon:yes stop_codon:yes gene_type:complete